MELPEPQPGAVQAFADEHFVEERSPVIGMATRFATEKGVEILLDALPGILEKYPRAQVLFAGQYRDVMGEQAYFERLMPVIKQYEQAGNWKFLGNLDLTQMAAYYPNLDVLVVPSLNSTEAFGLVVLEAMLNGTPCVASALPGVRQPVRMHGMGRVAEIGDAAGLAESILDVLDHPEKYQADPTTFGPRYDPDTIADAYEQLFKKLLLEKNNGN